MAQETKEQLEERLKEGGWKFLERRVVCIRPSNSGAIPFGGGFLMMDCTHQQTRQSDDQMLAEYQKDFKDVLLTDAYGGNGGLLRDVRDVNVKYRS